MPKEEMENSPDHFAFNRKIFQILEGTPERTKERLAGKEIVI